MTEWDDFVAGTAGDTLSQSSHWARLKAERFESERILVHSKSDPKQIIAGMQVLSKQTPVGKVGYTAKGPMLDSGLDPRSKTTACADLLDLLDQSKYRLLLIQPAVVTEGIHELLTSRGFTKAPVELGTEATIELDLRLSEPELLAQMQKSRRRSIKKHTANRDPFIVRPAVRYEIPIFAKFHQSTASRQGFDPTSTEELFHQWDTLHRDGLFQVLVVESAGKIVAGSSVTIWVGRLVGNQLGWDPDHVSGKPVPNDLLQWETILWCEGQAIKIYDMGASAATQLLTWRKVCHLMTSKR